MGSASFFTEPDGTCSKQDGIREVSSAPRSVSLNPVARSHSTPSGVHQSLHRSVPGVSHLRHAKGLWALRSRRCREPCRSLGSALPIPDLCSPTLLALYHGRGPS